MFCIVTDLPLWLQPVLPPTCSRGAISPIYFEELALKDSLRCLMDRPTFTMNHSIVDFNVSITCAVKKLLGHRILQLLSEFRHMGSGKNKCLEKIRKELLKRQGVLPIGITFQKQYRYLKRRIGLGGGSLRGFLDYICDSGLGII